MISGVNTSSYTDPMGTLTNCWASHIHPSPMRCTLKLWFWRKKKSQAVPLETLVWNLMSTATDPDKCWELASQYRKTVLPGNAITCETAFLMASISREIIRSTVRRELREKALLAAEAACSRIFDEASTEELPPEMVAIYGSVPLREVAAAALARYGEEDDFLFTTLAVFVHRIHGDPRMIFEIQPLVEEWREVLRRAFVGLLDSNAK
jgi:hypothetical protein